VPVKDDLDAARGRLVRNALDRALEAAESQTNFYMGELELIGNAVGRWGDARQVERSVRLLGPRGVAPRDPPAWGWDDVERIVVPSESDSHLLAAASGRHDDARQIADAETREPDRSRMMEEVAELQAISGEFDEARKTLALVAEDRRIGVHTVIVTELARQGRLDEASAEVAAMTDAARCSFDWAMVARGIAGEPPWAGYPFPDW
jgi:hypothetical protein